jgi:16S rRNA (guanine966-N2)-methyltransferase
MPLSTHSQDAVSKVRIVGGTHRSRLIEVPDAIGLRPTPDRVRETLFNWLGQELDGFNCLDLFAGSGALGFEAASRGAASVTMVELAPKVMAHLRATQEKLRFANVKLVAADALKLAQSASASTRYDLVLLDPPYRQGWLERLEPIIPALLAPGARLYLEAENAVESFAGLTRIRQGKAGQVHYALFEKPAAGIAA